MKKPSELREEMQARIYFIENFSNGYYEKLGIIDRFDSVRNSNLYVLDDFLKKVVMTEKLIEKYKLEGNDLNSENAFEELRTNINLIFKPKSFFSFFG